VPRGRQGYCRVKLVVSGRGAAALGCVELLLELGLSRENVWLSDLAGVVLRRAA